MTLPDILLPTHIQMLGAMSGLLTKAETQRPGGKGADSAPGIARQGSEMTASGPAPWRRHKHGLPREWRWLRLPQRKVVVDPSVRFAPALPIGAVLDVSAERCVRDWALPQFFFHVVTAYAILRAQGIEMGKADYAAHMLPNLRPSADV